MSKIRRPQAEYITSLLHAVEEKYPALKELDTIEFKKHYDVHVSDPYWHEPSELSTSQPKVNKAQVFDEIEELLSAGKSAAIDEIWDEAGLSVGVPSALLLSSQELLDHFHVAPVLLWLPEVFDSMSIPCPTCKRTARYVRFAPQDARRVDADPEPFYVIGSEYSCGHCEATFMSYNADVVAQLPEPIQTRMAAIVTSRCAVSLPVFMNVMYDVVDRVPFDAQARERKEASLSAYYARELSYVSLVKDLKMLGAGMRRKAREIAEAAEQLQLLDFGGFYGNYGGIDHENLEMLFKKKIEDGFLRRLETVISATSKHVSLENPSFQAVGMVLKSLAQYLNLS